MPRPFSTRLAHRTASPLLFRGSGLALVLASLGCAEPQGEDDEVGEGEGSESDGNATDEGTESEESETGGPDRDALIAEVSARGPHEVGYKELELAYLPPGATEERVLPVKVWYPAMPDSGAPQAIYAVAGIVELPAADVLDGPPVSDAGPFPVTVYSHGSGGEGLVGYSYAERFASHGWIFYAPNHVGNTALDEIGGSVTPFVVTSVNRPLDISAVLDEADGGFPGEGVGDVADMERVFVFGHSFGGYTSLAIAGATLDYQALVDACTAESCDFLADPDVAATFDAGFADARVDAISSQAPALISSFGSGDLAAFTIPTMLQSAKLDQTTTDALEAQPAWAALDHADDVWIDLPFGGHYSFITICNDLEPELLDLFIPSWESDGCGREFTPIGEIVPVLDAYVLAFARLHVLGQTDFSVVLEGEPLHAEVDVLHH